MDRIFLDQLQRDITTILEGTFDDMIIMHYFPEVAYADEPFILVKGNCNAELFLMRFKLIDLLSWQENGVFKTELLNRRYELF